MYIRDIYRLYVLRDDTNLNSLEMLEMILANIDALNHVGIGFEVVAVVPEDVLKFRDAFSAAGVRSLPALAELQRGGQTVREQTVAEGRGRISEHLSQIYNEIAQERSQPDTSNLDYHAWVNSQIGTAESLRHERAKYGTSPDDEDDGMGAGIGGTQIHARFDEYVQERASVGMRRPSEGGGSIYAESEPPRSQRPPPPPDPYGQQPPPPGGQSTAMAQPTQRLSGYGKTDVASAIANTKGIDRREAAMLSTLYENQTTT